MTINNAILVRMRTDGIAEHVFVSEQEASAWIKKAGETDSPASSFLMDGMAAADIYSISPDLRDRVATAKTKAMRDYRLVQALNKHGVPPDRDLRIGIYRAFADLSEVAPGARA